MVGTPIGDPQDPAQLAANKEVVRRWIEAVNENNTELFLATMADDVHYQIMGNTLLSGTYSREFLRNTANLLYNNTKGGIKMEIVTMTAEADRVAVEFRGTAQMVTGVRYDNEYHSMFRVRDGKVFFIKEYMDTELVSKVFTPIVAAMNAAQPSDPTTAKGSTP